MDWILFILLSCGSGCIEVTARSYDTLQECEAQAQWLYPRAKCERRRDA